MRQADAATAAKVARSWVSRVERGHPGGLPIDRLQAIAHVLEIRVELVASWNGGEAARIVNERHSRMHELVATRLSGLSGWVFEAEVTFSLWGERGTTDILAWHAASRTLLVIELKTEIPDPAGLLAQVDRYARLSPTIGRGRAWDVARVATWVLVAESATNRRQLARHRTMLRNAFPLDGRVLGAWLRDPASDMRTRVGAPRDGVGGADGPVRGRVSGLAFLADDRPGTRNARLGPTRRVRRRPGDAEGRPTGAGGVRDPRR